MSGQTLSGRSASFGRQVEGPHRPGSILLFSKFHTSLSDSRKATHKDRVTRFEAYRGP